MTERPKFSLETHKDLSQQVFLKGVDLLIPRIERLTKGRVTIKPYALKETREARREGKQIVAVFIGHESLGDLLPATEVNEVLCDGINQDGEQFITGMDLTASGTVRNGKQGTETQELYERFDVFARKKGVHLVFINRSKDHRNHEEKNEGVGGRDRIIGLFLEGGMDGGRRIVETITDKNGKKIERRKSERNGLQGIKNTREGKSNSRLFWSFVNKLEKDGGVALLPVVLNNGHRLVDPDTKKLGKRATMAVFGLYPTNLVRATICNPITYEQLQQSLGNKFTAEDLYNHLMLIGAEERPYTTRGAYKRLGDFEPIVS